MEGFDAMILDSCPRKVTTRKGLSSKSNKIEALKDWESPVWILVRMSLISSFWMSYLIRNYWSTFSKLVANAKTCVTGDCFMAKV